MANEKYYFLCEYFNSQMLIYAIKSSVTNWHYFEEEDSVISVHISLPAELRSQIVMLTKLEKVAVDLDADQVVNYVADGKFVFKGKELKSCEFFKSIYVFLFIFYSINQTASWLAYKLINPIRPEKKFQNHPKIWYLQ